MRRLDESEPIYHESRFTSPSNDSGDYFGLPYTQSPVDLGGGDGQYFSDPYVSPVTGNPVVGTGLHLAPGQSYAPGVSRTGPAASVQPMARFIPGVPAGSLFGLRGGGSQYRGRVPYQRAFSVDLQDRLRRRRRRGLFL